jgi:hypothetical protein
MIDSERRYEERRHKAEPVPVERRRTDRRLPNERRRQSRLPIEIWMEEVSGDDVYFRRTSNISEGGVFFDRAIPHPVGTVLNLRFTLPDHPDLLEARGEVTSISKDGLGMGVRFIEISGNGSERLSAYLSAIGRSAGGASTASK